MQVYNTERVLLENINEKEIIEYIYDSLNKIIEELNDTDPDWNYPEFE